jgi:hypothetical protein
MQTFPRLYNFPIFETKLADLKLWSSARRSPFSSKLMSVLFCKSDETHARYGSPLRAKKGYHCQFDY